MLPPLAVPVLLPGHQPLSRDGVTRLLLSHGRLPLTAITSSRLRRDRRPTAVTSFGVSRWPWWGGRHDHTCCCCVEWKLERQPPVAGTRIIRHSHWTHVSPVFCVLDSCHTVSRLRSARHPSSTTWL